MPEDLSHLPDLKPYETYETTALYLQRGALIQHFDAIVARFQSVAKSGDVVGVADFEEEFDAGLPEGNGGADAVVDDGDDIAFEFGDDIKASIAGGTSTCEMSIEKFFNPFCAA